MSGKVHAKTYKEAQETFEDDEHDNYLNCDDFTGIIPGLLLLSRFSRVRLCATRDGSPPAPPSLGFSRQEHWSGLPFPSPMHESEVTQLCPTLSDPMDCSLPGSSIHGIFQARVLEWGAIAFSGILLYELLILREPRKFGLIFLS